MSWSACSLLLLSYPNSQSPAVSTSERPEAFAAWVDFDSDGRLDVYLVDANGRDRLYRNSSDGGLEDLTSAVGLAGLGAARFGLWEDVDRDGRPDLVRADAEGALVLFKNRGGALLEAAGSEIGLAEIAGALHGEWRDVDRDGWVDLWVITRDEAVLLRNVEGARFEASSVAASAGASAAPAPKARAAPGEEPAEEDRSPTECKPEPSERERRQAADARTELVDLSLAGFSGSGATPLVLAGGCARTIDDQAGGACIGASSVPAFGKLYPLGPQFNISGSGNVGIGTTVATHRLTVDSPTLNALKLAGPGANDSKARLSFGSGAGVYLEESVDEMLTVQAGRRSSAARSRSARLPCRRTA